MLCSYKLGNSLVRYHYKKVSSIIVQYIHMYIVYDHIQISINMIKWYSMA